MRKTIFVGICACFALLCAFARAESNETLTLRPLQDGAKVLAHFRFSTREHSAAVKDSGAFPKVLQQILTKYGAESLHLTFALGKHSDARYGTALGVGSDALAHAPFGTRLQVRLRDANSTSEYIASSVAVQERWRGITAELGGIFSASLNQMDLTVVTDMPDVDPSALGAFPADASTADSMSRSQGPFLHATLAREEICTENLAPWLKMLPCRSHAGLGKLIDPIKYVSGEFLSLSLFASRSAQDDAWVLEQQLVTVQALNAADTRRWSLQSVFFHNLPLDDMVLDACPLATQSVIYTETPSEGYELLHAPDATTKDPHAGAGRVRFSPPVTHATSLATKEIPLGELWLQRVDVAHTTSSSPPRDLVAVHRFVTGYGQVHGGIAVRLENNHPLCAMRVTYHDVVPWYLRMFFSTFQARAARNDASSSSAVEETERLDAASLITDAQFVPAEVRGRPNEMHVELLLPANASLVFSVQLEKAFLRLSEHPPDANRGFDVASGVATFEPIAQEDGDIACRELRHDKRAFTRTLFTEPLLVPLPTPDFSMPYNVITMTSTVVAFFVGSMLNTLLRKAPRIKQMMAPQ